METYEGTCRGCGQIQSVIADSQEDADEMVSEKCACGYGREVKRHKDMLDAIYCTCNAPCEKHGFEILEDDQRAAVTSAAEAVFKELADQIQLKMESTVITITKTKRSVRIKRQRQEVIECEDGTIEEG